MLGILVLAAVVGTAAWLSFRPPEAPPERLDPANGPSAEPASSAPESPDDTPAAAPPASPNARVPPPEDLPLRTIEVLIAEGEGERAIRALDPWLAREPDNPRIYRARGRAWLDGQSWRRAERDFARSLELEGEEVTTASLDGRAAALIQLRKTADARKLLERSLALAPDRSRPHALLALAHLKDGDAKAARTEIDRALTLDPTDTLANGLRKRLDSQKR